MHYNVMLTYIMLHYIPLPRLQILSLSRRCGCRSATEVRCAMRNAARFLIRRQRGHPAVVLPLVISNSANH